MAAGELVAAERRARLLGCLFWTAASIVIVLVRGVRWDETYEHALAITRIAPYPEGHPFFVYTRNVFSLQSYLSAGMLWMTRSALAVCFFRDLLTMLFVTLPLFLFTFTLTRRALWGHVAVILALCGVYGFFASHYGMGAWTGFFSVGGVGAGYALLAFTAFLAGWTRTAWFLLTFLAAVHLGQLPPLLLFAGLQLVRGDATQRKREWRAAIIWGGAGFAVSVAFYLVQRLFIVPLPTSGAYLAEGDPREIWINYSMREDVHRFIEYVHPYSHSLLLIAITLAVAFTTLVIELRGTRLQRATANIVLYALCVALLSVGIRIVHGIMRDRIPYLLIGWMPYRIPNHLAPILLGLCLAIVASRAEHGSTSRQYPPAIWAVALSLLAQPIALAGRFMPAVVFERYLEGGECIFFFAIGGALGVLVERMGAQSRIASFGWVKFLLLASVALLFFNQFIVCCAVAGFAFHWALRTLASGTFAGCTLQRAAVACVGLVLALLLVREWQTREFLPRTRFQEGVVRYLAEAGDSTATIVPPYWDVEWSARTGAPVFLDYQTPRLMTYMPSLGPSLRKMVRDLYGFSIDGSSNEGLRSWTSLTPEQWQTLGDAYGIRYFIHLTNEPCSLAPVYSEDGLSLYEIPERGNPSSPSNATGASTNARPISLLRSNPRSVGRIVSPSSVMRPRPASC
jgi:hypothetical protein